LYPGVDGKKPGDVGVTERLGFLRDAGSRLVGTLKNFYSRIQLNSWCDK